MVFIYLQFIADKDVLKSMGPNIEVALKDFRTAKLYFKKRLYATANRRFLNAELTYILYLHWVYI